MNKSKIILIIIAFYTFYSNAQIVNEGSLYVSPTSLVSFFDEYTNKASATMTNKGIVHYKHNLINNGIMTESANANTAFARNYFTSSTNVVQKISGANKVVFENMIVEMTTASANGVLVEDGMELLVERSLNLISGDLRLVDEAQLIQKHTGTDLNTGSDNLLRDQQGIIDTYRFNYWSSPVSDNTAGDFSVSAVLYDGSDAALNPFTPTAVDFITGNAYNGNATTLDGTGNVTDALDINRQWFYKFENGGIGVGTDWAYVDHTGVLDTGIGYTMKGPSGATPDQNYVFKGKPNDGSYSFILGVSRSTLLGNPYPCAMDANKFINDNTVSPDFDGTIYYWEHWGGGTHTQSDYQGGYAAYNLSGGSVPISHPDVTPGGTSSGVLASRWIPVGQAFFIESTLGGTVVIDNSQRVFKTEDATSFFRNSGNDTNVLETEDTVQRIRLAYNNPDGFYRQIMTAFIPETTDGLDLGYDGRMADVNQDEFYWTIADETPYVIAAQPYRADLQMALGLDVVTEGFQKIYIDATENFDGDMYILDTLTMTTHDLRASDFEINLAVGQYLNRFFLVFQPQSPLNTNDIVAQDVNVFYADAQDNLVVENPNNLELKSIQIYNAIGQLVKQVAKTNLNNNKIEIPVQVASGAYFVHIVTNKGMAAYKVLVY